MAGAGFVHIKFIRYFSGKEISFYLMEVKVVFHLCDLLCDFRQIEKRPLLAFAENLGIAETNNRPLVIRLFGTFK
jgi:hypothetical protein